MARWLVKSEPETYSWDNLVSEGRTAWTGIRNAQARIHLAAMQEGDEVFFYHSQIGKEIVGIAEVVRTAYPDPTAEDPRWLAVDLRPVRKLDAPVSLVDIKGDPTLAEMVIVRHTRLSVTPVSDAHFARVLERAQSSR